MKILILNWRDPKNPKAGGAERVTLEHAKAWKKNGGDVLWLAGGYPQSKSSEEIDGIAIYRYGNSYTIYFMAPFIYLFKFKSRVDFIIDEIHGLPFFTPLWAKNVKKVAYIHEVAQDIWDDMFTFPINIIGRFIEKYYFRFYKKIPFLTVSKSTMNDLVAFGLSPKNITVLPNGLSVPILKKPAKKNDKLTLLYVARLVKMKGIEHAIAIFNLVQAELPDSVLWIVGNGETRYINELKENVRKLGLDRKIIFYGFVDSTVIVNLYQKATVLLHTSTREGFGLVVIEANSQGTPAMVYNSAGLRDTVKEGVNGYIFEKGDHNEMAKSIVSLYTNNDRYIKLAQSSINYASQFSWGKITQKSSAYIQKVYER